MKHARRDQGRVTFTRTDKIGALAAEDDVELLSQCFIDIGDVGLLMDCSKPETIVLGRTGSGKSALIWHLSTYSERVIPISAENLALKYISNSTILSFVLKLGLQLDPFFRLLWRHVFVIEIIKRRFNITSESSRRSIVDSLREVFMRRNHKKALDYVRKWEHSFWQYTDTRIKEVTGKFEEQLENEIKLAVPSFDIRSNDITKLTEEQKCEIRQRAETVINELQVRELAVIIAALPEILNDPQKQFYITIDRLDENWVDERIKYLLVRALIETVRDFVPIENVKVIIALRSDLMEKVLRETRDTGFQEEKYESLYLRLSWSREELIRLLKNRVEKAFKSRTTTQPIILSDLMLDTMGKQRAVDYMVDRTLMRPRDLILFFNESLKQSVDRTTITAGAIRDAEGEYSRKRLVSLGEEWATCYPNIVSYTKILRHKPEVFSIRSIVPDECMELAVDCYVDGGDELSSLSKRLFEEKINHDYFIRQLVYIFYRVGIVGLKSTGYESYQWAFDGRTINSAEMTDEVRIKIHPCFWRVLGVVGKSEST